MKLVTEKNDMATALEYLKLAKERDPTQLSARMNIAMRCDVGMIVIVGSIISYRSIGLERGAVS